MEHREDPRKGHEHEICNIRLKKKKSSIKYVKKHEVRKSITYAKSQARNDFGQKMRQNYRKNQKLL